MIGSVERGQTDQPTRLPRITTVLAGTVVMVFALWMFVPLADESVGGAPDRRMWSSMVVAAVTGIVVAILVRTAAKRPEGDPTAARWALAAIIVGTALGWAWLLMNTSDEELVEPSLALIVVGVALLAAGSAAWRSLRALAVMLGASWAVVGAVCLKLIFWDDPRFTGPLCSGTIECFGQGLPADNAGLFAFMFPALMVVPLMCQFVVVLIADAIRPTEVPRGGVFERI